MEPQGHRSAQDPRVSDGHRRARRPVGAVRFRHGPPPEHYPRGPCSPLPAIDHPIARATGERGASSRTTTQIVQGHGITAHVAATSQCDEVGEVSSTRARQPPDSTSDHAYAVKSCFPPSTARFTACHENHETLRQQRSPTAASIATKNTARGGGIPQRGPHRDRR